LTRVFGCAVAIGVLVAWAADIVYTQAADATEVLAAAREALGGDKQLSAVRSFVATGRTRQLRGNNLVPIEFEMSCELPDKFVRKDEFPAQDTDPTTVGFNGNQLIQLPPPPQGQGRAGAPAAAPGRAGRGPLLTPEQQRLATVKQDFVRLTLGMFATSFPSYPLTFRYAARGEAPEGQADIIDVAGPANLAARLVVQRATHLPVMLIWQAPATAVVLRIPGQAPPNSIPPGAVVVDAPTPPASHAAEADRDRYAAALADLRRQALARAKPVEYRLYYGDFREVDGVRFPHRMRRSIAGETVEETTFDRIRVNVSIDARKFEVPK
jgi:hypothetical protein